MTVCLWMVKMKECQEAYLSGWQRNKHTTTRCTTQTTVDQANIGMAFKYGFTYIFSYSDRTPTHGGGGGETLVENLF